MSDSTAPTLFYTHRSPPARACLLVCKAIGLEANLKPINLGAGEQHEPWFLAINPLHTVPTLLEPDGRAVCESHAINTYLIRKYGGRDDDHPLYPSGDPFRRAQIDQRMYFDAGCLFPAAREIVRAILYKGAAAATDEQLTEVHRALAFLETFLAQTPYVVGDTMSVADLTLVTTTTNVGALLALEAERYPKIGAWLKRMQELPYFHEMNTVHVEAFRQQLQEKMRANREALEAQH